MRQDLHLRSPGPKPGMLLLHHALRAPVEARRAPGTCSVAGRDSASLIAVPRRGVADPMGFAPTAFPQTTGCSPGLSYGSKKWWEVLVTLQSSLPACWVTPGLRPGCRDTSLKVVAGVGVAPTKVELMRPPESHSPRMKLVESAGNAPAWACLQGRCIACLPRPHVKSEALNPKSETSSKLEVRITGGHGLTAPAPRRAVEHAYRFGFRTWDFGIPSNFDFGLRILSWQAASVLPRAGWVLETRLRELARGLKVVRLPGIAPGHAPWRGAILRLNHSRGKSEGREPCMHASESAPGPRHFNKDQTPLGDLSIPTRGFTAVVSVFRGTPPAKPFDCKSGPNPRDVLGGDRRAHPTGGEPRLSHVQFVLASRTSARCRVLSHSPSQSFRCSVSVSVVHRENKKPCSPSVSRAGKSWSSRDALYLLTFRDLAGGYVPGPDRH